MYLNNLPERKFILVHFILCRRFFMLDFPIEPLMYISNESLILFNFDECLDFNFSCGPSLRIQHQSIKAVPSNVKENKSGTLFGHLIRGSAAPTYQRHRGYQALPTVR